MKRPTRGDDLKGTAVGMFRELGNLLDCAPMSQSKRDERLTEAYNTLKAYQKHYEQGVFRDSSEKEFFSTIVKGRSDHDEQRIVELCFAIQFLLNYSNPYSIATERGDWYPSIKATKIAYYEGLEKQLAGIYDYQMENNKYFPSEIIRGNAQEAINKYSVYLNKQTKKPSRTRKKKVEITKTPPSDEDAEN
jgi:hypothetical protein